MKAFIIVALSADGYIAKNPTLPSTTWTGPEDKKRFVSMTKQAGVLIMGLNTWKTIGKALKDRLTIVYSPEQVPNLPEGVEITSKSPADLLHELEGRGFKEVAICGGSQIYTMFMKSGLVNKIYTTVEPIIFGDGIRLFKEELDFKLNLVESIKTESGAILNEYEVES